MKKILFLECKLPIITKTTCFLFFTTDKRCFAILLSLVFQFLAETSKQVRRIFLSFDRRLFVSLSQLKNVRCSLQSPNFAKPTHQLPLLYISLLLVLVLLATQKLAISVAYYAA